MATEITIADDDLFDARSFRVWTSPTLETDPEWTGRPFLHVNRLTMVVGPDIDECVMEYHYGDFIKNEVSQFDDDVTLPDPRVPLDLNRLFCKVELIEHWTDRESDPTVVLTWYGIIEVDDRSTAKDTAFDETGTQQFTAFGLLRLLDTTFIRSSRIQNGDGDPQTIGRGMPFNSFPGHAFPERGNRTRNLRADSDFDVTSGDMFAWAPAQAVDLGDDNLNAVSWTAQQALKYLAAYHRPQTGAENDLVEIVLSAGVANYTDWFDITVPTERQSVKRVLDLLIDRRRIVGYHITGSEPSGDLFQLSINVFGFSDSAISLPDGDSISANDDQVEVEVENSRLVEGLQLRKMVTHLADLVIAEGDYVTSTLTLRSENSELEKGWTSTQESDYDDADADGRQQESLKDVWARFPVPDNWDMQVTDEDSDVGGGEQEHYVAIDYDEIPDNLTDAEVDTLWRIDTGTQGKLWFRGKRFLDYLAISDGETSEFRRPFVLFQEPSNTSQFLYAENLSHDASLGHSFNVSLRLLQDLLGIQLTVNQPGGQHLVAGAGFSGEDDVYDDVTKVSWGTLVVTGTIEWDERCRAEKRISTPDGHDRVRVIFVPDSRLDIEHAGTITDVSSTGSLTHSNGKVLRDDRARLRSIAEAAAAWYGTERNPLVFSYNHLGTELSLGQLITKLFVRGSIKDTRTVNTPITGITYTVTGSRGGQGKMTTRVETSYADADFVQ